MIATISVTIAPIRINIISICLKLQLFALSHIYSCRAAPALRLADIFISFGANVCNKNNWDFRNSTSRPLSRFFLVLTKPGIDLRGRGERGWVTDRFPKNRNWSLIEYPKSDIFRPFRSFFAKNILLAPIMSRIRQILSKSGSIFKIFGALGAKKRVTYRFWSPFLFGRPLPPNRSYRFHRAKMIGSEHDVHRLKKGINSTLKYGV